MTSENFTTWRKAAYSVGNGNCVEVGASLRAVGVRDTVQRERGPLLEFSPVAWRAFIDAAKTGRS
jgi:hypothetical protein